MNRLLSLRNALSIPFVTLCFIAGAAESTVTEAMLAEKLRFYAALGSLEADFKQVKELREMGMDMKSEGRLTLKRPDVVVWEILKPARVKVELGTTGIKITSGEGANATGQSFSADQMPQDKGASGMRDLVAWLKLDAKALSEQYVITKTPAERYLFEPRKTGPFKSMEMALAKDGHLETLVLNEASGDRMTLTFAKPRVRK